MGSHLKSKLFAIHVLNINKYSCNITRNTYNMRLFLILLLLSVLSAKTLDKLKPKSDKETLRSIVYRNERQKRTQIENLVNNGFDQLIKTFRKYQTPSKNTSIERKNKSKRNWKLIADELRKRGGKYKHER